MDPGLNAEIPYPWAVYFAVVAVGVAALVILMLARELLRRRNAEASLLKSEARFRAIYEFSPVGMVMIWNGKILAANPAFQTMLGYSEAELKLLTIAAITHPNDVDSAKTCQLNLENGEYDHYQLEMRLIHKQGAVVWISISVTLVRDQPGLPPLAFGIAENITERKHYERERNTVASLSASLRTASRRSELLPILLTRLEDLLQAEGALAAFIQDNSDEAVVELGSGIWKSRTATRLPAVWITVGDDLVYVSNDLDRDLPDLLRGYTEGLTAAASIRLTAEDQTMGSLWLGRRIPWNEEDVRILMSIADIATNAIRRITMHEQTARRVEQLQALRAIDEAIVSNKDLKETLMTLINKVVHNLQVDAADILLMNQKTGQLELTASDGFRLDAWQNDRPITSASPAGQAMATKQGIHIPNLEENRHLLFCSDQAQQEAFQDYYAFPLLARDQVQGVLEVYHRSPLNPDQDWIDFSTSLTRQAAIAIDNASLIENLKHANKELISANESTLVGWVRALDLRDEETEGHSERVTELTLKLAQKMHIPEDQLGHIRHGALLHDIGKMGVRDSILLKTGPLTEEEWTIMRKHPFYAYKMIEAVPYLRQALDIPYCHHERWDGSGYPRGLVGEEIPPAARIFAVVDVWDALVSRRPYREPWTDGQAEEYMKKYSGVHFDPAVVSHFLEMLSEVKHC